MRHHTVQSLTAMLCVALFAAPAQAQSIAPASRAQAAQLTPGTGVEVELRGSERLKGTVVAQGQDTFALQAERNSLVGSPPRLRTISYRDVAYAGTPLQIKVWKMKVNQRARVQLKSGPQIRGTLVSADLGSFLIQPEAQKGTAPAEAVRVQFQEVVRVNAAMGMGAKVGIGIGIGLAVILAIGASIPDSR